MVHILREIKEKAKIIQAVPIPLQPESTVLSIETSTLATATSVATRSQNTRADSQSETSTSDMGVQSAWNNQGHAIGTQSEGHNLGVKVTDTGEGHRFEVDEKLTEDQLKKIHNQVLFD